MPLRVDPPDGADLTLYRTVGWGGLARFYVLDGRQYRDDQACDQRQRRRPGVPESGEDDRTMLGADQEAWLGRALGASEATWNVLAQQTIVSPVVVPLEGAVGGNLDQWDGYGAARRRLVDQLREVDNPVVLTGDIHASGVGVVSEDPDDPASPPLVPRAGGHLDLVQLPGGPGGAGGGGGRGVARHPLRRGPPAGLRGVRGDRRQLRAEFRYVATVATPQADIATGATWLIAAGDPEPRPALIAPGARYLALGGCEC